MQQRVVLEPLLPVTAVDLPARSGNAPSRPAAIDFIYEPSKAALLDALVPLYVADRSSTARCSSRSRPSSARA